MIILSLPSYIISFHIEMPLYMCQLLTGSFMNQSFALTGIFKIAFKHFNVLQTRTFITLIVVILKITGLI